MNLKNQKLFDFFADNHELSLLESEMTDIVDVVKSVITPAWVSVNDRLPTHIYSVLAYVVDGGFAKYGEPMKDIVVYNPNTCEWLQNIGDAGDEVVTVTHWMDLPQDPAH
ncbi:DUF551 domain-containing protein [Dasania sp. GY-MA-18]|uniref:DUF551 domain-containing protein n=1 Tax=Dasania phycosphaerae TaxID=2950436 RepID=A0A9J6RLQ4_9GAMM|nr:MULTISPECIES: DUF551 domain-containing protein [Dasania]MCR8922689.1 DUF551 domain-containing protein [Dasania sp. GY-MA-18]MCZ0865119.1 DUF551 domain-containing protein [Dasania phycosphaerae]MCZ0868845.1 DUF551 domain-containing protein [Dasania phycosphaerae]